MRIIGKNGRTKGAVPTLTCPICSLSLYGIYSSPYSWRARITGQARVSTPVRRCFCNPSRLVSGRGALQTQDVTLKHTPRHYPRRPLLLKVKSLRCKSHVPYFHILIYFQAKA